MTPKLILRTDKDNPLIGSETTLFIDDVVKAILELDCSSAFKTLIGSNQNIQKAIIKDFQNLLCEKLNGLDVSQTNPWQTEVSASKIYKDAFDLHLMCLLDSISYQVIIELDKNRADQIAKKFLSRVSHTIDKPTIYFAFCYPGTDKMNLKETKKYFEYFSNITTKMNSIDTPKIFVGLTTEK